MSATDLWLELLGGSILALAAVWLFFMGLIGMALWGMWRTGVNLGRIADAMERFGAQPPPATRPQRAPEEPLHGVRDHQVGEATTETHRGEQSSTMRALGRFDAAVKKSRVGDAVLVVMGTLLGIFLVWAATWFIMGMFQ